MIWTSEIIMEAIGKHMLNECITNERLVELTKLEPRQVENSTLRLRNHGFIKLVDKGCYRVTQDGITALQSNRKIRSGPKGQQATVRVFKDSLRARVWRAIRIRKNFSIPELTGLVARGDERDAECNIRKYLIALEGAGYLIRMKKRIPGTALTSNGFARWRLDLEKNTGPEAPIWRSKKETVFDPNTNEEVTLVPIKKGQLCG